MQFIVAQNPNLAHALAGERGLGKQAYRYLTLHRYQGGTAEYQPTDADTVVLGPAWEIGPGNSTLVRDLRAKGMKVENA